MNSKGLLKTVFVIVLLASLPACYYVQAVRGQVDVLKRREAIDDVIRDPATPDELTRRLQLVMQARQFSIDRLHLPDNDSYRTYADLERDYVVWNVFAAPEFSLQPKKWCYPVVGCVSYRGYFSEAAANKQADKLRRKGFDTAIGGVPAYSTLGRFDDPVLNTMMRWDDIRLVSTLFHELAHQVLYIKNDTGFNESFATTVEEIGIRLWLAEQGEKGGMTRYRGRKAQFVRLVELVGTTRDDLGELYASGIAVETMRARKAERLQQLEDDIRAVLDEAGINGEHWLTRDLNNARLLPISIYEGRVDAFRALYAECEFDLDCFYAEATALSELDSETRNVRLDALQRKGS